MASRATPGGKPALMEPRASVREKAEKEGKRKEKTRGERERRRKRTVYGGLEMEHR